MKFIGRLAVAFYVVVVMFCCSFLLLYATHLVPIERVQNILSVLYYEFAARLISFMGAVVILFLNFTFMRALSNRQGKGKTVAFNNPEGRVTVSVNALEDLVRRSIARVSEVRDVRVAIAATRKGLEIHARLILNADVNIPGMTSRIQDYVKKKVQNTIGIEETVIVRVDVTKIIPEGRQKRQKEKQEEDDDMADSNVPFHGYRM